MQDKQERLNHFKEIHTLLDSQNGRTFVDELELTWDQQILLGDTPEETAYNCGLRDAFKFIKLLQSGELIHE